jgi:integrase
MPAWNPFGTQIGMTHLLITDKVLERADPGRSPNGRLEIWDTYLPDFGYRATQRGTGSFFVMFRLAGQRRRMTIGRYPLMSLSEARDAGKQALGLVREGVSPEEHLAAERAASEAAEAEQHAVEEKKQRDRDHRSFDLIVADHILKHHRGILRGNVPKEPPNNRSWREVERVFKIYVLPRWGARDIATIRRSDVARLISEVQVENGPVMANRVLAHIRKLFNWAMLQPELIDVLEASPVVRGMAPSVEIARDRFLSPEEIRWLWAAAEVIGYPFGPCVQLLLVTGQRRDEVSSMTWAQLDVENRLWTLLAQSTKAKRRHEVPLSDLALAIIEAIPRQEGSPYLFTTTLRTPISGFSRAKNLIDATIAEWRQKPEGVGMRPGDGTVSHFQEPWRFHDLRRTVATRLEDNLSTPKALISAILNHAEGGATAVYTRGQLREQKFAAMQAWGSYLTKLNEQPQAPDQLLRAAKA